MKTLGKLKLNQFRKDELEKREMHALRGGCSCRCACAGASEEYMSTASNSGSTPRY